MWRLSQNCTSCYAKTTFESDQADSIALMLGMLVDPTNVALIQLRL